MSGRDPKGIRDLFVRPAIKLLGLPAPNAAERLLMGTAAQESGFVHTHQIGGGPALGLWQMEPRTCEDIWENYLRHRIRHHRDLARTISAAIIHDRVMDLKTNHLYAAAMCRVHYYRAPFTLRDDDDVATLAAIYKKYYNTPKGAGTESQFIANYERLVAPIY